MSSPLLRSALLICARALLLGVASLAACSPDIVDTDCLTDADCLVGSCIENASGDRVCAVRASGADAAVGPDGDSPDVGAPGDSGVDANVPDTAAVADADTDADALDAGPAEICDNGLDDDGDGAVDCRDLYCISEPSCPCGNRQIDEGEDCDCVALDGETCASLGFAGGQLFCGPTCVFDTRECAVGPPIVQQWDDWEQGDPVDVATVLGIDDAVVSCFETPSDDIDFAVVSLQALVAAAGFGESTAEYVVRVWNDGGDGARPTDEIYDGRAVVRDDPTALQTISLAEQGIRVRDRYCVGLETSELFGPRIAVDDEVDHERDQWVRRFGAFDAFWEPISSVASGDWILRATLLPVTQ